MATLTEQQLICYDCAEQKENYGHSSHDSLPPPPPPENKPKLTSHDGEDDDDEDEGYDSDVEFYEDGLHDMTKKEFRIYNKQVSESDGFDVDDFPDVFMLSIIRPILRINKGTIDSCIHFAKLALVEYNDANGTNWEFANYIKANGQVVCGFLFYITFEAKKPSSKGDSDDDDDSPTQIFQAKVLDGIPDFEVKFCRPKPNQL